MKKKQRRLRDRHNFILLDIDKQMFTKPSLTIENDAYSIKEVLEKFARGEQINFGNKPIYDDDPDIDFDDPTREPGFDFFDAMELKDVMDQEKEIRKENEKVFLENKKKQKVTEGNTINPVGEA